MSHIIIETLTAVSGQEQGLKQALLDLAPKCLAEEGCMHYEIAESDDNPDEFLVLMRMRDKKALEAHENSVHIAEFVQNYDQVLYKDFSETIWNSI